MATEEVKYFTKEELLKAIDGAPQTDVSREAAQALDPEARFPVVMHMVINISTVRVRVMLGSTGPFAMIDVPIGIFNSLEKKAIPT